MYKTGQSGMKIEPDILKVCGFHRLLFVVRTAIFMLSLAPFCSLFDVTEI